MPFIMKQDKKLEKALDEWVEKQYKDLLPTPTPSKEDSIVDSEEGFTPGILRIVDPALKAKSFNGYKQDIRMSFTSEVIGLIYGETKKQCEANAARIVKCWNEHHPMKVKIQDLESTVWAKTKMIELLVKEAEANAALIAESKNMYTALKEWHKWWCTNFSDELDSAGTIAQKTESIINRINKH